MPPTNIRGGQVLDGSVQRTDLDVSTIGQAVVRKIVQGVGVTLTSTGADSGTGDVTVASPVSADAGNQSRLGSDNLIYTPSSVNGFISKTAAYTLTSADSNKYIICSGGSWTLTLPTAALGLCYNVRNDMGISGTVGTITVARAGSATIDGQTSLALLPQQECLIISDGTNWRTFGLKREVILGTLDLASAVADSGTILLPAGFRYFEMKWAGLVGTVDNANSSFQISTNGGSTWLNTNYFRGTVLDTSSTALAYSIVNNTDTQAYMGLLTNTASASYAGAVIELTLYPGNVGASRAPTWQVRSASYVGASARISGFHNDLGYCNQPVLVNAIKFFASNGNIGPGFLTVKGVV